MANRYRVMVYDCSLIQDFVYHYEKYFDTMQDAKDYCESLMKDFADRALYEYSPEIYIRTLIGAYEPIGYFEFDCLGYDMDLFDLVSTLDDYDELGKFSYHEMF